MNRLRNRCLFAIAIALCASVAALWLNARRDSLPLPIIVDSAQDVVRPGTTASIATEEQGRKEVIGLSPSTGTATGDLVGTVIDEGQTAIEGAIVVEFTSGHPLASAPRDVQRNWDSLRHVFSPGETGMRKAVTDKEGRFLFRGPFAPGTFLYVYAEGYCPLWHTDVRPGEISLKAMRGLRISGRVEDQDGLPLQQVTIAVFSLPSPMPVAIAVSNADGRFSLDPLDNTTEYVVNAKAKGYNTSAPQTVDLGLAATDLLFRLCSIHQHSIQMYSPEGELWIGSRVESELGVRAEDLDWFVTNKVYSTRNRLDSSSFFAAKGSYAPDTGCVTISGAMPDEGSLWISCWMRADNLGFGTLIDRGRRVILPLANQAQRNVTITAQCTVRTAAAQLEVWSTTEDRFEGLPFARAKIAAGDVKEIALPAALESALFVATSPGFLPFVGEVQLRTASVVNIPLYPAQSTLQGRLTEPSGAGIAGASVYVWHGNRPHSRSCITDSEGRFRVPWNQAVSGRMAFYADGWGPTSIPIPVEHDRVPVEIRLAPPRQAKIELDATSTYSVSYEDQVGAIVFDDRWAARRRSGRSIDLRDIPLSGTSLTILDLDSGQIVHKSTLP